MVESSREKILLAFVGFSIEIIIKWAMAGPDFQSVLLYDITYKCITACLLKIRQNRFGVYSSKNP